MIVDQSLIVKFLSDQVNYPSLTESVRKIQTHGAIVFLAGDDVYKIKRDVRYPYLDFSTLQKRERACRRELEINQPIAPQIYLGVVPIVAGADGSLAIDGEGTPVEWAVHMRRFDEELLLQNLARTGRLTTGIADAAAREIAIFHQQAPRITEPGAARRLENLVNELIAHFSSSDDYPATDRSLFCDQLGNEAAKNSQLTEQRGLNGYVVRGHGDLHLANLVLLEGRPVLFDALEYSEEFATIDVLYDLAFLIMDLEVNGLAEQANRVLASYLIASDMPNHLDALCLLPTFLALRAGVRAMVETHRAQQFYEAPRPKTMSMGAEYLAYANRALGNAGRPQLIAVGGLSGTGKSTISRNLAPMVGARPGALHIRSDVERKVMHSVAETTRLPAAAYTKAVSEQVYARMMDKAARALRGGHSVILDAVFMSEKDRILADRVADECGAAFTGLWLTATMDRLHRRVNDRTADASDATVDVVNRQLSQAIGPVTWHEIDANGGVDQVLEKVSAVLNPSEPTGS